MVFTILRRKHYRTRMYHRIVLGCAVNIIVDAAFTLWGPAAVPRGTPHIPAARGTIGTCSITGFGHYASFFIVPLYFNAQALLAFASIRYKFQERTYQWMEKYIHIGVYLYPLGSGIYLLSLEAFNPIVMSCGFSSYPMDCSEDGIECIRGPENIAKLQWIFLSIPALMIVLIPTFLMISLVVWIRHQIPRGRAIGKSVTRKIALYLAALYWTYFFRCIDAVIIFGKGEVLFASTLAANTNEALIGLWYLLVYLVLRTEDPASVRVTGSLTAKREKDRSKAGREDRQISMTTVTIDQSQMRSFELGIGIFDGNCLDEDSPWSGYLTTGVDEGYEKNDPEYTDHDYCIEDIPSHSEWSDKNISSDNSTISA